MTGGSENATGRPYAGRSPEERRAERRRRILDAALELYGTEGFYATSVAQLCRTAKVAPAKFYEEFAGSEELLIELCREIWTPLRKDILGATMAAAPSVPEMTRAAISAYCHGLLEDTRRARVVCVEFPCGSPAAEAARREQTLQFANLWLAGLRMVTGDREQALDERQMVLMATALVGALRDAVRHWLFEPEPRPSIEHLVEAMMTLYVAVARHLGAKSTDGNH